MALALAVGDLMSCRCWSSLNEQAGVNTYIYEVITVSGGAVTDQDLANAFDVIAAGFYLPQQSAHSRFDGVQVYFIRRAAGALPAPVKSVASAGPGTGPGFPLPPNTAPIMKYTTNTRGPAGRGRVFFPFTDTSHLANNGKTTAAFDVLVNSLASLLLAPLVLTSGGSSATLVWSLMHRNPKPMPPTTHQITQAESAQKFGQMHKRGSYGRANASPI